MIVVIMMMMMIIRIMAVVLEVKHAAFHLLGKLYHRTAFPAPSLG